jgi:predicted DNA-binding transcriptional regulator AlpA
LLQAILDELRALRRDAGRPEPADADRLIGMAELCRLLDRSKASLERDLAAGRIIAPVRCGGSRRWRLAEVREWIQAGCSPPSNSTSIRLRRDRIGGGRDA